MTLLKNPAWLHKWQFNYTRFEEIDHQHFITINRRLQSLQSDTPLVSIVIIAWNEEINILRCVGSLSETATKHPLEIIVVNNNSTDGTQKTVDKLSVKSFTETTQGAGPARQKGQEHAKGKYILTADADCIYPAGWVDKMIAILSEPGIVCVYGRYSFIAHAGFPRWKLFILEKLKDAMAEIRHVKQPYFNCFGISMGYVKEYGLRIGFIKENRRGEDGQLCLDLMQFGKIRQVRSPKARVWTDTRTLEKDGSFWRVIYTRIQADLDRFKFNFISRKPKNK